MPVVVARIARTVAPGLPHHVTQRGNRRQQTFFTDDDYQAYLDLLGEWQLICTGHNLLKLFGARNAGLVGEEFWGQEAVA